jgi:hypothetical protein
MARTMGEDTPLVARCLRLIEAGRGNGSEDDATVLVIHRRSRPRARLLRHGAALVAMLVAAALFSFWSAPAGDTASSASSPVVVMPAEGAR